MRGRAAFICFTTSSVEAVAVLQNRQQRAAPSVVAHDVGLHRVAVADLRDVAHVNGACRSTVLIGSLLNASTTVGLLFISTLYSRVPILGEARGQDQVLRIQCVGDVGRAQPVRKQGLRD